jgi:hypothetical protein
MRCVIGVASLLILQIGLIALRRRQQRAAVDDRVAECRNVIRATKRYGVGEASRESVGLHGGGAPSVPIADRLRGAVNRLLSISNELAPSERDEFGAGPGLYVLPSSDRVLVDLSSGGLGRLALLFDCVERPRKPATQHRLLRPAAARRAHSIPHLIEICAAAAHAAAASRKCSQAQSGWKEQKENK